MTNLTVDNVINIYYNSNQYDVYFFVIPVYIFILAQQSAFLVKNVFNIGCVILSHFKLRFRLRIFM